MAVAQAPGRRDEVDQRVLLGLVRAVGDVVLDRRPALVDRVGALAEAEVALAGARGEADPDAPAAPAPARRRRRRARSRPSPARLSRSAIVRVGSVVASVRRVGALRALGGDHAGRVLPAGGGAKAERSARTRRRSRRARRGRCSPRSSVSVEVPRVRADLGAQRARVDDRSPRAPAPRATAAQRNRERRRARSSHRARRRVLAADVGDQPGLLGAFLAAAQHPQREDRRAEQGGAAEADLDAEQALAGPVDVLELKQQRRLVEGEPDPGAEREREDLLEPLVRGRPGRRRR